MSDDDKLTLSEEDESTQSFFMLVSGDIEYFSESDNGVSSVKILATVMELDKPSANNRLYQFSEGEDIAASLVGKPVYYGVDKLTGKHDNPLMRATSDNEPCGVVESAFLEGSKVKAKIRITMQSLVDKIRGGAKFLFSVGGHAINGETLRNVGGKIVKVLHNAICNHLQIVDSNVKVGFPNAKMERVLDFGETVLFIEDEEKEEVSGVEYEYLKEKAKTSDKEVKALLQEKIRLGLESEELKLEGEKIDLLTRQALVKIRRTKAENEKLNREILADEEETRRLEEEVFGKIEALPDGKRKELLRKDYQKIMEDDGEDDDEDAELELSETEDDGDDDDGYVVTD